MRLRDHYDGGSDSFEGERTIVWRSLPENAVVTRATLTIEPRSPPGGKDYVETLRFSAGGPRYGATIRHAGAGFVEIDFRARRTAIGFAGLTITAQSTLAVDIGGGVYLAVGADGTIPAAPGSNYGLIGGSLPGITALRLRLGQHASSTDDLSTTTIDLASMPSNLTLRFGKLSPFWSKTGELAVATTTPDITSAVQRALADATVVNGFYAIPLVVHSDRLGRIAVTFDVEYLGSAPLIAPGLREVVLPYDYASLSTTDPKALQAMLPAGAAVRSPQTSLQIRGAFDAARVAYGPTGATNESATAHCSATETLAQPIAPTSDINVSAVDLFVAADGPAARLALDLRADSDGKPSVTSLLAKAVPFDLAGNASAQRRWTSVPIAPAARLTSKQRYWVIIQALDGAASLGVDSAPDPARLVQRSTDAGFSWRLTGLASPLLLRLRTVPDRFHMPIDFAAGTGAQQQRVSLSAYDALGKVDAVIDRPEIASAVQSYVEQSTPAPCQPMDLLQNPDFSQWTTVGTAFGRVLPISLSATTLQVVDTFRDAVVASHGLHMAAPQALTFSADGATLYVAGSSSVFPVDATTFALGQQLSALNGVSFGDAVALACDSVGRMLYVLGSQALVAVDLTTNTSRIALAGLVDGRALALTRDGRSAYVAGRDATGAAIFALDLTTGTTSHRIPIEAPDLTLTPDGTMIVAIDGANGRLASFDAATGGPGWAASLPQLLLARAVIAPANGNSVYVVAAPPGNPTDLSLLTFDSRGRIGPTPAIALGSFSGRQIALAVKPQGDRLYAAMTPFALAPAGDRLVAVGVSATVEAIIAAAAIGARQPTAWTLTAGSVVSVETSDDPPRLEAFLSAGSLSQVVAVAPGCSYDLAVETLVTHPLRTPMQTIEAVAEVFWLDSSGTLLRGDSLALPNSTLFVRQQKRLTPPPASAQAEIRVRVADGICLLRATSLKMSDSVLQDDAWRPDPAAPSLIVITKTASATTYRNTGIATAALVQNVTLNVNTTYLLDFSGSAIAGAANASPDLELSYQNASGAAIGTPSRIAVDPIGFSSRSARLTAPPSSTAAQLRIVLPAASALVAERLQLLPQPAVAVPCTFIAQSSGELHVSRAQIVYDWAPAAPPLPPKGGLSAPTPPDRRPGDPACPPCPCEASAEAVGAAPVPVPAPLTGAVVPVVVPVVPVVLEVPLTSIQGIGAARAERLVAAGIRTVRDLATATPARIIAAFTGTVAATPALASTLIERAKLALAEPQTGGSAVPSPALPPGGAVGPSRPGIPATMPVVPDMPLTSIQGIGAARAGRLVVAGIRTVRDLAAAAPARIVAAFAGTVAATPALASTLIERAKLALAEAQTGGWNE
ncbi:Helix-hairpin-helix domain-containing protein [Rhizobiales bacterium GAS188]|nr:Helix-hairpin-helix domain-containing protein [Rhizobiales bacterium GAS188]